MAAVVTSDGVTLHVTDEGRGEVVMLIAGYTAPATSWVFQVEALTAAGFRVVCLDRRSHGRSEAPDFGQRIARHAADIHDVLVALDLDGVAVVGGSMGASATWSYVDLFGDARLRGIVSVDQTPKMVNTPDWPYGFYGLIDANVGTFFAEGIPPTGRGLPPDKAAVGMTRLADRLGGDGGWRREIRPETLPLLRDHAIQDWRDVIERVSTPVLMVAGRDSQFWPCEHAALAVEKTAEGRAVVIDDCGHAANIDRPEEFNALMIEFLRSL